MNHEANLYIRMWSATKDPEYIRLFREAMTQRVYRRTGSSGGGTMDEYGRKHKQVELKSLIDVLEAKQAELKGLKWPHQNNSSPDRGSITERQLKAYYRDVVEKGFHVPPPGIGKGDPEWQRQFYGSYGMNVPPDRGITEEQLIAEIEGTR